MYFYFYERNIFSSYFLLLFVSLSKQKAIRKIKSFILHIQRTFFDAILFIYLHGSRIEH